MSERTVRPEVANMVQILLRDIATSNTHVNGDEDQQFWRRSFCRNVFAFIEGYTSMLRAIGVGLAGQKMHRDGCVPLTTFSVLMETTYTIQDTGKLKEVDQKQNTIGSIAYVLRTVGELLGLPDEDADRRFADIGWRHLREANTLRGKLMHPKTEEDLDITDEKLDTVANAFRWYQCYLTRLNELIPDHMLLPKDK
jgi:hypothetical protein